VEETEDGYLIDWPAFAQFGFGLLEKFAEDPNAKGDSFSVAAKRSHYFGTGVKNAENMVCLRVISPTDSSREIYAFASEGSLAADEIKEQFRWGRTYRPRLQLEWVGPAGGRYIRVKNVVGMGWRDGS
jgi:hypothetical protein